MDDSIYTEFLESGDTLRVYAGDVLVFSSRKDRLKPLLEYLDDFGESLMGVVMMDRMVGNAAALLMIQAGCSEVYSPLGSKLAEETLKKWGVKYQFGCVVPYIEKTSGLGMCPMEELSLGKSPAEFYLVMLDRVR